MCLFSPVPLKFERIHVNLRGIKLEEIWKYNLCGDNCLGGDTYIVRISSKFRKQVLRNIRPNKPVVKNTRKKMNNIR